MVDTSNAAADLSHAIVDLADPLNIPGDIPYDERVRIATWARIVLDDLAAMRERAERAEARVKELEARYIPPPQPIPKPEPTVAYERLPDAGNSKEYDDA